VCVSRLHLVVGSPDAGEVTVEDMDGARHRVSLLAYDGDPPEPGQWLVVHSGFALGQVDAAEARAVAAELASVRGPSPGRRTAADAKQAGDRST